MQAWPISIHAPRVGRDSGRLSLSLPLYLFQSTRPVWGATGETWNRSNGGERFQSTRPVWGATRRSSTAGASSLFQSTRPVWGATFLRSIGAKRCTKFQSTRPVWGATGGDQLFDLCGTISIHAPRVGRDAIRPRCRSKMPYFNPRAPCGARPDVDKSVIDEVEFQSTRPVWGATASRLTRLSSASDFNPRAPCGARRMERTSLRRQYPISIHAPRVGRDLASCRSVPAYHHFNPRAPCGARQKIWEYPQAERYFNPRAPCGARRAGVVNISHHLQFQSTRPVWGATTNTSAPAVAVGISIHAPRVGRDSMPFAPPSMTYYFNPRAPCGARRR